MPFARCRPRPPAASRPTPHSASYALLSTRQDASAFNQPLSFDTSGVTDMEYMFEVRSAHALAPPSLHSRALLPCVLRVRCRRSTPPPASRLPPRSALYALLSTRQSALAFNQPLSFDTSSVTDMRYMFHVRSAHALAPTAGPSRRAFRSCAAVAPRPTAPRSASYALLSPRQYTTAFNQPLSFDTSSVTSMDFMFSVRSAHALALPSFPATRAL